MNTVEAGTAVKPFGGRHKRPDDSVFTKVRHAPARNRECVNRIAVRWIDGAMFDPDQCTLTFRSLWYGTVAMGAQPR